MGVRRDASKDGRLSPEAQARLQLRRFQTEERVRLHREAAKQEKEILEASLTDAELKEMLRPSRKAMEAFRAIQEGDTRRNSREVVTAVLKPLEYLLERKGGGGEGGNTVTVVVRTLEPVGSVTVGAVRGATTHSLPSGEDVVEVEDAPGEEGGTR